MQKYYTLFAHILTVCLSFAVIKVLALGYDWNNEESVIKLFISITDFASNK